MKLACCNNHVKKGIHLDVCEEIRGDDGKILKPMVVWAAIERLCADYLKKHERYEKLRKLNPQQLTDLYRRNIAGEGVFDDLVDALGDDTGVELRSGGDGVGRLPADANLGLIARAEERDEP